MIAAMLRAEVREGLLAIRREPTALLFSIAMPVAFFLLFVSIFGGEMAGDVAVGTTMLATFGTYGVLAVLLMNPGIGVADDRERGWLRAKRVSAAPVGVVLAGKVVAGLPYAVGVLLAMALAAAATGSLTADAGTLLRLLAVLVLGGLPFALLGLAVGLRASANAAAAILNAVLIPAAVASGLWMPLEVLPDVVGRIAPYLPTYHLAQVALAQISGGPVAGSVLVLVATAVGAAGLAALSYRTARP